MLYGWWKILFLVITFLFALPVNAALTPIATPTAGGIGSINGNSNSSQIINGSGTASVVSSGGTTTVNSTLGPNSTTDGAVSTWNGTSGTTLRNESTFNINPTTSQVIHTPPAQNIGNGDIYEFDLSNPTNWKIALRLFGTMSNLAGSQFMVKINPMINSSSPSGAEWYGLFVEPTGGQSSQTLYAGSRHHLVLNSDFAQYGINASGGGGVQGELNQIMNNSSGVGIGTNNYVSAKHAVAVRGLAVPSTAGGEGAGVWGQASQDNITNVTGGLFQIGKQDTSSFENTASVPFAAAASANNGNTGADIYEGYSNGGSIYRVDTNGNIFTQGGMACGYNYTTSSSNFTIGNNVCGLIINAGAIVSITVTMPSSPYDGQMIGLTSVGAVTTLTVNANAGQSMGDTVTSLAAGATVKWQFVANGVNTWFLVGH